MMNIKEILGNYTEEKQRLIKIDITIRAMFDTMDAPKTDEDFKVYCDGVIRTAKAKQEEEDAKAKTKADKEAKKAEAMGYTLEQYKEYKRLKTNKRRKETEIEKMQEQIAEMQKEIARKQKEIKKIEKTLDILTQV